MGCVLGFPQRRAARPRAIVKLLGRAAIVLVVSAFDLATWLFWAVFMLFGFGSYCNAAAERMTMRFLQWRKLCPRQT